MTKDGAAVMDPEVVEAGGVLDLVGPTALEAMVRGEIDVQIATAKRYPRSLEIFYKRAIAMATIDDETAESCLYRRPVGKKKNAKGRWEEEYAEGMSIRMAEIIGACYGNMRVYATLVEQTPQTVRARGMAIDLETNFASSSEVIESTLKQDGQPYSARMRVVVAKATLAKARRDATFQVVPKALAKPVETAVRKVLLGDEKTLVKRREAVLGWVGKLGIDVGRVWAALSIEGPADLGPDQLVTLTGLRTAIKDNETTIDEAFPDTTQPPQASQRKSAATPPAVAPATTHAATTAAAGPGPAAPPRNVGIIVAVNEREHGTLIKLSTGLQCATRDAEMVRAAYALKTSGATVELMTTPAPGGPQFAPVLQEMTPVAPGGGA